MDKFRNVLPKMLGPHLVVDAVRATLHYAPNSPGRSYAPLSHIVPSHIVPGAVVHRLMLPHPLIGFGLVCVESCTGLQVLTHHVLQLLCPSVYTGWAATLLVARSFTPTTPVLPTGPRPLPLNPCTAHCSCSSPCRQGTSHPPHLGQETAPCPSHSPYEVYEAGATTTMPPSARCSVQMHDGYPCCWLCKDKCNGPFSYFRCVPCITVPRRTVTSAYSHTLGNGASVLAPDVHCALVEPQ